MLSIYKHCLVTVLWIMLQGIFLNTFGQSDTTIVGITRTPNTPIVLATATTITLGQSSSLSVSNCNNGAVRWNNGQVGNPILVTPNLTRTFYARCIVAGCTGDSTGIVINVITVTPAIGISKATICQGETTKLTALGCGGTVEWNNGQTTIDINVSPANTTDYSVVCITSNGRSNAATSKVTVNSTPSKPTITASTTTPLLGSSVVLTGNCMNSNYAWSTNETTNSIARIPLIIETITLSCIGSTGCTSESDSKTLQPLTPNISVTASKDIACAGETISLTVTGCPNNKSWSTGDNSNTTYTIINQTTTYEVTCYFSTGEAKASITVTAIPLPNTPSLLNSNPSILKGNKSLLTAKGCEDGTKIWELYGKQQTSNSDTITVYPTQTNTYKVACSKNGCSGGFAATTVTVYSSDTKILASPNQICQGDSSQLSLSNCIGAITWSNGKVGKSFYVKPSITTIYKAYCQITTTLKDSSTVEVKVIPIPVGLSISATFNNKALTIKDTVAINSPVTLEMKGCVGTVNWNIGVSGPKLLLYPLETQNYIATCTNTNGCKALPLSTTFVVRNSSLSLVISKSAICKSDYATITSKGCPTEQLSWKFVPDTNEDLIKSPLAISFKPISSVKVIASCKLSDLQTIKDSTIITVLPKNNLKVDSAIVCLGKFVDLATMVSNQNQFSSLKFYDGVKEVKIVTPLGNPPFVKTYKVVGINASGCKDSTFVNISVKPIPDKPIIKSDKLTFPIIFGEKVNLKIDNCIGEVTWINPKANTKSVIVEPINLTTYKAICTSPFKCISDTASITIDVSRQLAKITAPNIICEETPFQISSVCQTNTLWGSLNSFYDGNTITIAIPRNGDSVLVAGKPIFRKVIRNDSTFITGQATCFFKDIPTTFKGKSTSFEVFVPLISINDLYFYPNPATKIIKIGSNSCLSPSIQVRIWDLIGRNLFDSNQSPIKNNEIDISELPSGEYIVEIMFDKDQTVKKMLKYTNNQ